MIQKTPREANGSERWGRWLIIVGSYSLAVLLGSSIQAGVNEPMGTARWWAAVLKTIFFRSDLSVGAWVLLAVFVFGSLLNLWGLKEAIRRAHFTIGWLMVVVAVVALICVGLRLWPMAGVGLLLASPHFWPALLIEKTQRAGAGNNAIPSEDQR